jgi:putative endonuclease
MEEAKHILTGKKGEKIACRLLKNKGLKILCRNYKSDNRTGEIDIVARDGAVLCFVEVKTRYASAFVEKITDDAWLNHDQANRVRNAAKDYLVKIGIDKIRYRFDLIEITLGKFGVGKIHHWEGNFGLSE